MRYVRPGEDFRTSFKLFNKCDVNGSNELSLFRFLKKSCPPPNEVFKPPKSLSYSPFRANDIRWNFEKFLLDRNGRVNMRFDSRTESERMEPFIEILLNGGNLSDLKKFSNKLIKKNLIRI